MSAQHTPGPLSPNCMRLVKEAEASAQPIGASMVTLHTCDGDWLFRVHKDIEAVDLQTMLQMHGARFRAGERAGREQAFASLRAFIGVDDAIANAARSAG